MRKKLHNFKKSFFLLFAFLFIQTVASATVFTAVESGNFNNSTTWGGTVPSFNNLVDQIIIPSGITVNLDNDLTMDGALTQITVNGKLTSSSNTKFNLTYGTINGNGIIDVDQVMLGTGAAIAFTGSFSSRTITNNALNLQTTGNFIVKESLTLSSGIITIQSGGNLTFGNNSTLIFDGGKLATNGGSLGLSSLYNVHYKSGNTMTGAELGGTGLNNVTVEIGSGNTLTLSNNLIINGMLTLTSGTLVVGANNLTLNGGISAAGSGNITTTNSNLTINSPSGTNGTLNFGGSSNALNNFTVNVGNLNNAQLTGTVTVNGNLTLTSGTLQLNSSNLILKGGITSSGSGNISSTATSNITVNTTSSPLGALTFASSGNTLNSLTISIGGGGTLMIGSDLNIHGSLNFLNGKLDLVDNKLTIANDATITAYGNSSYIITGTSGALSMNATSTNSAGIRYPVGTMNHYLPAVVMINSGSNGGKVEVGVWPNVYKEGTSGIDISNTKHVVDATWIVTSNISSNLNMNLKVMWASSLEVNGFMRTNAYLSHYMNNKWDVGTIKSANTESDGMYSITRNNITSLSPFAVFDQTSAEVKPKYTASAFTIYPNPGSNNISLNIHNTTKPLTMEILNINGQLMASDTLENTPHVVSVKDLNPGCYFIKLYNSEINTTHRFIKN